MSARTTGLWLAAVGVVGLGGLSLGGAYEGWERRAADEGVMSGIAQMSKSISAVSTALESHRQALDRYAEDVDGLYRRIGELEERMSAYEEWAGEAYRERQATK